MAVVVVSRVSRDIGFAAIAVEVEDATGERF